LIFQDKAGENMTKKYFTKALDETGRSARVGQMTEEAKQPQKRSVFERIAIAIGMAKGTGSPVRRSPPTRDELDEVVTQFNKVRVAVMAARDAMSRSRELQEAWREMVVRLVRIGARIVQLRQEQEDDQELDEAEKSYRELLKDIDLDSVSPELRAELKTIETNLEREFRARWDRNLARYGVFQ
jgi:Asp-tRNA(Asn)/Glu-tRNA(Gln) amidotransferase A subunit family amidase